MSLIVCPECGHEVSTTAAACQNCGYTLLRANPVVPKRVVVSGVAHRESIPKWVIFPVLIVGLMIVFLIITLMRNNDETANKNINIDVETARKTSRDRQTATQPIDTNPNQVTIPPNSTTVNPPTTTTAPPPISTTEQNIPPSSTSQVKPPPTDKGTVKIDAKIINKKGEIQSVKNEKFYLLTEDLESILTKTNLDSIEGNSLSDSFGLAVMYPERYREFNSQALAAIKRHIKYDALTDGSGKASMKDVKPERYYLFGITKTASGFAIWNSPVSIIEGENQLNLSPVSLNEMSE